MNIRKLESHEIALHRQLRLRALRESPESFRDTAEQVEQQPSSYWADLTRSVTEPDRHIMFLAYEGDAVVGSIYGLRDRERRDSARIGGTWVARSHRRRGVGRESLEAVISWAREHGFSHLALWAPSANSAALALCDVHIRPSVMSIRLPPIKVFVLNHLSASPVAGAVATLTETKREALASQVSEMLHTYADGDGMAVPDETNIAIAHA
jgi:GNAT superfamily N-acetyltransferase